MSTPRHVVPRSLFTVHGCLERAQLCGRGIAAGDLLAVQLVFDAGGQSAEASDLAGLGAHEGVGGTCGCGDVRREGLLTTPRHVVPRNLLAVHGRLERAQLCGGGVAAGSLLAIYLCLQVRDVRGRCIVTALLFGVHLSL